MVDITTLLTATSHLWHLWWMIFVSTSMCVFTLLDQSPCNVWRVWHAKQEMLTPRAPDLTFFWGFTLLHGLDFYNQICLCPLDFMKLGNRISEFVLFWMIFSPFQPKSWPKLENRQKWSRLEHYSNWLQIVCVSHIKWISRPFQPKVDQTWKIAKSKVGSNIAPNGPY